MGTDRHKYCVMPKPLVKYTVWAMLDYWIHSKNLWHCWKKKETVKHILGIREKGLGKKIKKLYPSFTTTSTSTTSMLIDIYEECPKHHGHKGGPGMTPGTYDAVGERALGVGNASHP